MATGVCCGALRPAPAQPHALLLQHAPSRWRCAPASFGRSRAAQSARPGRRCVAPLAAAAAGLPELLPRSRQRRRAEDPDAVASDAARGNGNGNGASEREPPSVHVLQPPPDERTVAELVRRRLFATESVAVAALTRIKCAHRFAYDTAVATMNWLQACLATARGDDGLEATATVIRRHPRVLTYTPKQLQTGWETLTAAQTEGGLGYTPQRAAQRVCGQPQLLTFTRERVATTAAAVELCGLANGVRAVAQQPALMGMAGSTLLENAAWWRDTGLDYRKILTAHPTFLALNSIAAHARLQKKLDWLRSVARMSVVELDNAGVLLGLSLEDRLRPRFFYARLMRTPKRFSLATLMSETDASFVAFALGRGNGRRAPASADEVARYVRRIKSPVFIAWSKGLEARLRSSGTDERR